MFGIRRESKVSLHPESQQAQPDLSKIDELSEEQFKEALPGFAKALEEIKSDELDLFASAKAGWVLDQIKKDRFTLEQLKKLPIEVQRVIVKYLK